MFKNHNKQSLAIIYPTSFVTPQFSIKQVIVTKSMQYSIQQVQYTKLVIFN